MMIIKTSAIISLIASISLVLTTFGIQESFAEENISDMSNNKFQDLFEAKITEIVNGELIIRSYYFATPEEAERFEQMMQNTGDATYYQLEIIGEEIIDGKTKLVAKAIPVTFTKYTDNPQKPVPEGYVPYTTPKIQPSLQEIIDSGVEKIDIRTKLKNTPKLPPNFLQMSDEEQLASQEKRYAEIRNMQQDLVDYIINNDGVIIKQLEIINNVYADVPVVLIDELENRDDILTMGYYDENVKVISSGDYVSPQINDTTPATSIENRWYVKLIHEDIVLDFEITSEDIIDIDKMV